MPANIIDGKSIAKSIRAEVAEEAVRLSAVPGLGVVLVGEDPASVLYVGLKEKACAETGIRFETRILPGTATTEEVVSKVEDLNGRPEINAVMVQLPLPEQVDTEKVIGSISPAKDVECFHPENISAFLAGKARVTPVLQSGIMKLVEAAGEDTRGKCALVIAKSREFYAPLEKMLTDAGSTTHFETPDSGRVKESAVTADILIVAVGRPGFITGDMVKPGAIIIDVGTNRTPEGLKGDVDLGSVSEVAGHITPVPGGVGPMTVAMLLRNVVEIAKK